MLCVSVSIHSRRGALSVLPRTRCQTPLPPPSMLPPRDQPAKWRTSLPGCPRTCVSHTNALTHTGMAIDFYAHKLVTEACFCFGELVDFLLNTNTCNTSKIIFLRFWLFKFKFSQVRSMKLISTCLNQNVIETSVFSKLIARFRQSYVEYMWGSFLGKKSLFLHFLYFLDCLLLES